MIKKLLFILLLAAFTSSAFAAITYVDAELTNTKIDGMAPSSATYSTGSTGTDGKWRWRTMAPQNGEGIWESDAANVSGDAETTPDISVDVVLPSPGVYDLYVLCMNNATNTGYWDIACRIGASGDFAIYNKLSPEMTLAQAGEFEAGVVINTTSNRHVKVLIGQYVATAANETVTVYINGFDSWNGVTHDHRTVLDGIGYEKVSDATFAYNPTPAHGAVDVAVDVTLSWLTAPDPETGLADPNVKAHYLYLSSGNPADPNLYFTATIPAVGTGASYGPLSLSYDSTCRWQIEEAMDNGKGGYYAAGEPNNAAGPVWTFETLKSMPVITGHPVNVSVFAGAMAEFTVAATSISPISYEWFSSADNANNTLTDDISVQGPGLLAALTLSDVQAANEKYYYCKVSNAAGGVYSDPAGLEVKRLVAYYAFENTLEDSSGHGNHGTDPNGSSFAGGVTGGTSALVLDASQHQYVELPAVAYPKAGLGGGMAAGTISLWVKPTQADRSVLMCGLGEAGKTGFALYKYTDTQVQMFIRNEAGQSASPQGGTANLVASGWHHVAATWQSQGQVKVYSDGIEVASASGITANFADWPYGVLLGAGRTIADRQVLENYYSGAMDELKVYNYALDKYAIADSYYAVTGQRVCINDYASQFDYNQNCMVDLADFATFASHWLECGVYPDCSPNTYAQPLVYIGTAWLEGLEELADRSRWSYVADRAGLWVHPQNQQASQMAAAEVVADHLLQKHGILERNALPTEADILARSTWAKTNLGLKKSLVFYFNGGVNFADALWNARSKYAQSLGMKTLMGLAPHRIDDAGWSDPFWDTARFGLADFDGYAYDAPQKLYVTEAESYRRAVWDPTQFCHSKGKPTVYLLSCNVPTAKDFFEWGQQTVIDLHNRGLDPMIWGIENYTRDSVVPMTPEINPDGTPAYTVTGLAYWIFKYYESQ